MTRNRLYVMLLLACLAGYAWLAFMYLQGPKSIASELNVCIFKAATGFACPSCGATRSVMALADGNFADALYWNPIGIFIAAVLVFAPLWIGVDVLRKNDSLANTYRQTELFISKKHIAIPAAALLLANWIWNIIKGV